MFTSTCVVEPFGETPAFIICSLKKRNLRAISPHLFIFTRTNIYPPDISKSIISVLIFFQKNKNSLKQEEENTMSLEDNKSSLMKEKSTMTEKKKKKTSMEKAA